jgi:hypothetical protein
MKAESSAMCQVLLDRLWLYIIREDGTSRPRSECLVTYGALCSLAGVPHLTRYPGRWLQEIAEWCAANGWPPLNSLAINAQAHRPGSLYHAAPGCSHEGWENQVDTCIAFRGYPRQAPAPGQ